MIEAMIYGAAGGLVLQFLLNCVFFIGLLMFSSSGTTVDWKDFIAFTVYFAVAGAAIGLVHFRVTGQVVLGG